MDAVSCTMCSHVGHSVGQQKRAILILLKLFKLFWFAETLMFFSLVKESLDLSPVVQWIGHCTLWWPIQDNDFVVLIDLPDRHAWLTSLQKINK